MGTPKACLEWHGSTLLYRTAALLRRTVAGPVVVVLGAGDLSGAAFALPALPAGVTVVYDPPRCPAAGRARASGPGPR